MRYKNAPLPPGFFLTRYQIQRRLSAGGFGVVYLARRLADNKPVAIKEFLPQVISCRTMADKGHVRLENDEHRKRFSEGLEAFFREADILSRINDPRVIQVWDVFQANGTAYFAMPLEKGSSLQSVLKTSARPLTDAQIIWIFSEACQGVDALHGAGLLHLDIKPGNLWMRPDGSVVVLDLGASRWEDEEGRLAHLARTPGYAAPEQHGARRAKGLTIKTDVYGLGASIHACIEGRPPASAPTRHPDDPSLLCRRMGQRATDLLALVDRATSLLPGNRQPTVSHLLADLQNVNRPLPLSATTPRICPVL